MKKLPEYSLTLREIEPGQFTIISFSKIHGVVKLKTGDKLIVLQPPEPPVHIAPTCWKCGHPFKPFTVGQINCLSCVNPIPAPEMPQGLAAFKDRLEYLEERNRRLGRMESALGEGNKENQMALTISDLTETCQELKAENAQLRRELEIAHRQIEEWLQQ